jgi:hypothetical protein
MKANGWGSNIQSIDLVTIHSIQSFQLIPAEKTYLDGLPAELSLISNRQTSISFEEAEQYPALMYWPRSSCRSAGVRREVPLMMTPNERQGARGQSDVMPGHVVRRIVWQKRMGKMVNGKSRSREFTSFVRRFKPRLQNT